MQAEQNKGGDWNDTMAKFVDFSKIGESKKEEPKAMPLPSN